MAVAFSRFPARVKFSDGRLLRKTAVVIVGDRVRIAEQQGREAVVVEDRADVASLETQPDRTMLVTLADGAQLRIGKGDGCSCGSPLKSWFSSELRGET